MPGPVARALPTVTALLALTACSSTGPAPAAPHPTTANAPYLAACKAEDKAYQQVEAVVSDISTASHAYPDLMSYSYDVEMAMPSPSSMRVNSLTT